MMQKLDILSNTNPIIFEATVPSTADKNLFFLLGSLRVDKIKLISFAKYIGCFIIIFYLFFDII